MQTSAVRLAVLKAQTLVLCIDRFCFPVSSDGWVNLFWRTDSVNKWVSGRKQVSELQVVLGVWVFLDSVVHAAAMLYRVVPWKAGPTALAQPLLEKVVEVPGQQVVQKAVGAPFMSAFQPKRLSPLSWNGPRTWKAPYENPWCVWDETRIEDLMEGSGNCFQSTLVKLLLCVWVGEVKWWSATPYLVSFLLAPLWAAF